MWALLLDRIYGVRFTLLPTRPDMLGRTAQIINRGVQRLYRMKQLGASKATTQQVIHFSSRNTSTNSPRVKDILNCAADVFVVYAFAII